MDFEQLISTIVLCMIVGFPILILLVGPFTGGKKVEMRELAPLLMEAVDEFKRLTSVRKDSYEAFEEDMITLLHRHVTTSNVFRPGEKELLNKEVIGTLIRPYLKKMYQSKP